MLRHTVIVLVSCTLLAGLMARGADEPQAKEPPAKEPPATQPAASQPAEGEKGWVSLFNGKDLDGWQASGNAKFYAEDGCLVGTQTDGRGGDLATTRQWDNFELRVTYRVKWPANSGFWFRWDPKTGRGYQYDVLKYTNPVAFSGSLYCAGKMFLTKNLDESLENRDGWNEARVLADGDELVLWLNGKEVGRCRDKSFQKGCFGVQVHGGGFKGMKIIIKRIEIRPLPVASSQ